MAGDAGDGLSGVAHKAAGIAKRALGELTGRPDLVLEGEAEQAEARIEHGDWVSGWKLERGQRADLLARFPPRYASAVADHVTLRAKVAASTPPPPSCDAAIVGRADDGRGVEAMVVAINGSTDRPDGMVYHITWSLERGRRPVESNAVIARLGWETLAEPIPVTLEPALFR